MYTGFYLLNTSYLIITLRIFSGFAVKLKTLIADKTYIVKKQTLSYSTTCQTIQGIDYIF